MLTRQLVGIVVNCSPREIVNSQIGAKSKGANSKNQKGTIHHKDGWKGASTRLSVGTDRETRTFLTFPLSRPSDQTSASESNQRPTSYGSVLCVPKTQTRT